MSTFKGIVEEFPQIRIDYFRKKNDFPAPLACFLSHVHSDHLAGLESLKAPFVYCSAATKEMLLRLEKYPARMNFAKGVLETRKQTYRHLKNILKPLPLETPTIIELSPASELRVTLLDSNHCTGAVMFLIEGKGKAILYTGDMRSESWVVNSLCQNPTLLPYTTALKSLDTIYLDTTFANQRRINLQFPSKAKGIHELLSKVSKYPDNTVFYFMSWTFGYENVWMALSSFLASQIHLDPYRLALYRSLASIEANLSHKETPHLCGYRLGNHLKSGCLTSDYKARIHSCEPGGGCDFMDYASKANYVCIMPVVTRLDDGTDVPEVGVGGGKGDLDTVQQIELHDETALNSLLKLCQEKIEDKDTLVQVESYIIGIYKSSSGSMAMDKSLENNGRLDAVIHDLIKSTQTSFVDRLSEKGDAASLPRVITFPYSRHSSYSELCEFVEVFKPKDVYPCTVDELNWTTKVSIKNLFGHLCSGTVFRHDTEMEEFFSVASNINKKMISHGIETQLTSDISSFLDEQVRFDPSESPISPPPIKKISKRSPSVDSLSKVSRVEKKSLREWAYTAALGLDSELDWNSFGGLSCTKQTKSQPQPQSNSQLSIEL